KPRFQGFEAAGGDPFAGFHRAGGGPGRTHFEFRSSGPGGDAGDIFSEIFGQAFRGAQGARSARPDGLGDLNATLDVSVEDVATEAKVHALFPDGRRMAIKLPRYV